MSNSHYTNLKNTEAKKTEIGHLIDDFAKFYWRGHDMWQDFNAFIVNNKSGSLKFYNGPSFSNSYSAPEFDNGTGNLLGVTLKRQTIDFTIGVYGITIEKYRKLLNCLSPYAVDYLSFGFDNNYSYLVKLSSIGDSVKYPLDNDTYYTELTLKWELQGPNCARSNSPLVCEYDSETEAYKFESGQSSDLNTPVKITIPFTVTSTGSGTPTVSIKVYYDYDEVPQDLICSLTLHNLTSNNIENIGTQYSYNIVYDSETGLVFLEYGSSNRLLTLLTTNELGETILSSLSVKKFELLGSFNNGSIDKQSFRIEVENLEDAGTIVFDPDNVNILSYGRTNIA